MRFSWYLYDFNLKYLKNNINSFQLFNPFTHESAKGLRVVLFEKPEKNHVCYLELIKITYLADDMTKTTLHRMCCFFGKIRKVFVIA